MGGWGERKIQASFTAALVTRVQISDTKLMAEVTLYACIPLKKKSSNEKLLDRIIFMMSIFELKS